MSNQARVRTPSTAHNRISHETSWRARRIAAVLVGIWFGGILLVALAAPASFRSVDSVMAAPPQITAKVIQQFGPTAVREMLHYQVGEANRLLFDIWGWIQLGLGLAIFLLLLFLSTAGRPVLGLSLGMAVLAFLMNFIMIPRISDAGREMRATAAAQPQQALDSFRLMHLGFTVFEMTVVVSGTILLVLLLRSRTGFSGRRELSRTGRDDAGEA